MATSAVPWRYSFATYPHGTHNDREESLVLWRGKIRDPYRDARRYYNGLYQLNMNLLTWTKIRTVGPTNPGKRYMHTFTALPELNQIVLYGGYPSKEKSRQPSWIWIQCHGGNIKDHKIIMDASCFQ